MAVAARRLHYQQLLYFWAVVRAGSLTKAGADLHLSAPTVSAQRLMDAALELKQPVQLVCRKGTLEYRISQVTARRAAAATDGGYGHSPLSRSVARQARHPSAHPR